MADEEATAEEVAGEARHPFRFQYAAKILCTANVPGTSQTTPSLLPGVYQTVVNIHNPGRQGARLRKKLAVTSPPAISKWLTQALDPDEATSVDCQEISQSYGIAFVHGAEGFLVVESTHSLDVVAVYTAGAVGGSVTSIDVETVPERSLAR
jgi:hypothetical protein